MKTRSWFFMVFGLLFPFLIAWTPPIPGQPQPSQAKKKVEFICQSTGEFNIAPNGESLHMETWCVERYPPEGQEPRIKAVDDRIVRPARDSKGPARVFRVPFDQTEVSLEVQGSRQVVKVHYRDDQDAFHTIRLPPRNDRKYRFDFSKLVLDTATGRATIHAESEVRWLEP